jgi:hypothetical protein
MFIFTNSSYPGLASQIPAAVQPIASSLNFGDINLHTGTTFNLNLHGLNRSNTSVPSELMPFAPDVFWQDQQNSKIKYKADGNVDTSCGSMDSPCLNSGMASSNTPSMTLQASPQTNLYGVVYQPRGSWITMQGSGGINSPAVFVTGAMSLQGSASLTMLNSRDQLLKKSVVLIE